MLIRIDESSDCAQYGLASLICDLFDIEKRTAEEVIPVHPDKISPAERIIARQEEEEEDEDSGVSEEIGEAEGEIADALADDLNDLFDKRDGTDT